MSTIITRNSATSGSTPSSLVQGELAINVTDGRLFYGSGSGNVVKEFTAISASYALTASFITASGVYGPYGSNSVISASYAETASSALNAQDILIKVLNQSGNPIAKGVVVHITASGNSSDIPRVITASYENDNNSANTLGITNQAIANGAEGFVITEGILKGINTNAFQSGQLIYLGATGSIIGTAPVAPLHNVRLGQVVREQTNNGSIYVRIDNGYELEELHDVLIVSASSGDLVVRSGSIWVNSRQLTGSYGLTGSLRATSFTGSFSGSVASPGSTTQVVFNNGGILGANSGFVYSGSNIGIGTSSPTHSIHVSRTSTQPNIIGTNTSPVSMKIGHGYDLGSSNNITSKIEFNYNAPGGFWADDIIFSTSPQVTLPLDSDTSIERMRITSTGNTLITGSLTVTGSQVITGSLRGNVSTLSIASNTASLDMRTNNFFILNLVNGANTHINPTNIQPGQTVNIRVNQDSAGTGTVSFPSFVDQPSGSAYTGSQIANAIDIVTMITFDSSLVFVSSVRNMI